MADTPAPGTLEERKFDLDAELRRREIALKEAEGRKPGGISAAQATVAGAALALVSGVSGAFINSWSTQTIESGRSLTSLQIEELKVKGTLELEKQKQVAAETLERKRFETSLILEAIKTPAREDAIRNLKFFVQAGFIADLEGKIGALDDDSLPSIVSPSAESTNRALQATGIIKFGDGASETFICNGAFVSAYYVVTANFCVDDMFVKDPTKISIHIGGQRVPLEIVEVNAQESIVLLRSTLPEARQHLNRGLVREPKLGEPIYMAVMDGGGVVRISTCRVTAQTAAGGTWTESANFEHDCESAGGSAGAIIIAATDDALVGMHHSAKDKKGIAAKLTSVFSRWRAFMGESLAGQQQTVAPEQR
jgi:hypothetical protein